MKTKFRQANGLTAYALLCGYVQRIEIKTATKNISLELWSEGNVYHVRAHDYLELGRLEWVSEELLSDARSQFNFWVKKLFSDELKQVSKDKRFTFNREFIGEREPAYVCRFNGSFVGKSETLNGSKIIGFNYLSTRS